MNLISAEQEAISVKQFSKLMGVSLGHVYRLIQERELPFIKLGSRYLFRRNTHWNCFRKVMTSEDAIQFGAE